MSVVARADVWETRRRATAYDAYVQASRIDEDPKRDDEAEALYRRALELDPGLVGALTNLGNICYRRRRLAEATEFYRRAAALDERHAEAHYNLGYVLLEGREAWRSIPHFRRALAAKADFADAHFNLAVAYERIGEGGRSPATLGALPRDRTARNVGGGGERTAPVIGRSPSCPRSPRSCRRSG